MQKKPTSKTINTFKIRIRPRVWALFGGLLATALIITAIILTNMMSLEFCSLCIKQRYYFGVMGIGFFFASLFLFYGYRNLVRFILGFVSAIGAVGISVASKQVLMQAASGNTIWFTFFTIPQWSLVWFIILTSLAVYIAIRIKR